MTAPYFPLFVNLEGKRATIIGGGDTACKKSKLLLKFGMKIHVISPEISYGMEKLVSDGHVLWLKSEFSPDLLEGADLLVAATNVRKVNHNVYKAAKEQRILVNVSDSQEESSFLFPAIVRNDSVIAGAIATDGDINSMKRLIKKLVERLGAFLCKSI